MRILGAIVEPTTGLIGVADLFHRRGIRAKPVGDDAQRSAIFLHDALEKLQRRGLVPLRILGAAGESLGMDRQLRTSTVKRRVHSLFRQGCLLYDLIPNMPEASLRPLIERYQHLLRQNATFSQAFGIV